MKVPENLKYTPSHEWALVEGTKAKIGITDFAQSQLGDIVFINLPEPGDELVAGEPFSDVESVKAVSEVVSPVSGVVTAVNEDLLDDPALINESSYEAWFVEVDSVVEGDDLLDAAAYLAHCEA